MPTAQTIFTNAWIDLGVGSPGDTPGSAESSYGLTRLNIMLDNWSAARDLVYEIADANYALTAATQTYAIGLSASSPFNVARPIRIENAQILITVGSGGTARVLSFDLEIVSQEKWQSIDDKAATGTVPTMLYYDPSVPNGSLNFWPVPLCVATTQVDLGTWNVVGQFAALATNANLPPAYYRLILLGLELELVPVYGNLISPQIVQTRQAQFQEALAAVRSLNSAVQQTPLQPTGQQPGGQNPQLAQLAAALQQRG